MGSRSFFAMRGRHGAWFRARRGSEPLAKSSADSWKGRIWSIPIDMPKSAGQHCAGYAALICCRPALRHGLRRELLIVVIMLSLTRSQGQLRTLKNSGNHQLGTAWRETGTIQAHTDYTDCAIQDVVAIGIRLLRRETLQDRESMSEPIRLSYKDCEPCHIRYTFYYLHTFLSTRAAAAWGIATSE